MMALLYAFAAFALLVSFFVVSVRCVFAAEDMDAEEHGTAYARFLCLLALPSLLLTSSAFVASVWLEAVGFKLRRQDDKAEELFQEARDELSDMRHAAVSAVQGQPW